MAMFNYESETLYQLARGEALPSSPVYVAECKKEIIVEVSPNYPQLVEYEKELLNFAQNNYHPGSPVPLEYQEVNTYDYAIVENAIPFNYKWAILKGDTKYRDIDTGDILDTFDETKNLELVSVKMPALTTVGKNLFDGEIEEGIINPDTGETTSYPGRSRSKNFIRVPKNTDLYINVDNDSLLWTAIYGYDENKKYLGCIINSAHNNKTFNTGNASYIKWKNNASMDTLGNIQVEEGKQATSYEPYKSNILTVNEEVELRGIDDVKDELNLLTGEATQRIGKLVFDGSEDEEWLRNSQNDSEKTAVFYIVDLFKANSKVIIDKFVPYSGNGNFWKPQANNSENHLNNNNDLAIRISKSKLTSLDIDGFRQWLSQNPITVQHELKEELVKTVDLNRNIMPYEGTNNYQVSSDTIPPQLLLSVPVVSTGNKTLNDIITEE